MTADRRRERQRPHGVPGQRHLVMLNAVGVKMLSYLPAPTRDVSHAGNNNFDTIARIEDRAMTYTGIRITVSTTRCRLMASTLATPRAGTRS